MMSLLPPLWSTSSYISLVSLIALVACGGEVGGKGESDAASPELLSISITPAMAALDVSNGVQAEQDYKVIATFDTGDLDVTAQSAFSVDDIVLGTFSNSVFRSSGSAGGESVVRAVFEGQTANSDLSIFVRNDRLGEGVPADAADLFSNASDDSNLAPSLVYPPNLAYMPPNLGDFEAHWTSTAATDLYELSLSTEFSKTRLYTTMDASAGAFAAFTPEEWSVVGASGKGGDVIVQVRALNTATPTSFGASLTHIIHLTSTDVEGGLYYWASAGTLAGGIYRHDMSRPGEAAEPFYTTAESGDRCVACHVLSRNGEKMAVTFDSGNGSSSIVDVATRQPTLPTDGTFAWNFAAFEPSGSRIVTVREGVMTLRDSATGAAVNVVPTAGAATHVDFAPAGDKIVYVAKPTAGSDWNFTGGALTTMTFDAGMATWGTPTSLFTPAAGTNAFYPSFSPDGEWVLFNQATEDAYDAGSAELYVMRSDGSVPPIKLNSPNVQAGFTNSWARWAPFEQDLVRPGSDPEKFFWLTFSSKRAFGVRLPLGRPQIWMTPFFPGRATEGVAPSAPAFRMPFQEIETNNHIAQWTTQVIPID